MTNAFVASLAKTARVRTLFAAVLVLACSFVTAAHAAQSSIPSPVTPDSITPPAGNSAFLVGHAQGSQGYVCLPAADGSTSWTINSARPEATLFSDILGASFQIITHFTSVNLNPKEGVTAPLSGNATWQSSLDSSRVWATVLGTPLVAGTDASCPNTGSIPCLLLQSAGNLKGATGGKLLANVTFIQRLNTNGGAAPTSACTVGQTQLQPYTADYFFFRADQK